MIIEVSIYCLIFREEFINGYNYFFRYKRKYGFVKFGVMIYGVEDVVSVNLGRKWSYDNNLLEVIVN